MWAHPYGSVVTERWAATWRFGARRGVRYEPRTTVAIDDFPAPPIQAAVGPP